MTAAADPSFTTPSFGAPLPRRRGYWRQALSRVRHQPVTLFAFAILLALLVAGALAPELAPEGWNWIHLGVRWQNHPPTLVRGYLFGTDDIGRSVLVRTLWGLHYSEQVAVVGAIVATLLGSVVGSASGYYGGLFDAAVMRFADLVGGFPVIVLVLIAFAFLQPVTLWRATLLFAIALWPPAARVVRTQVTGLKPEEFVQAARALGASDVRIVARHLLPNTAGTLVVTVTSLVGQIVLVEATAEFFGFGIDSLVRPTLGNLIAEATSTGIGAFNQVSLGWWVWAAPAAVLVVVLVCLNVVGDGLDHALNPHSRK